MGHLLKLMYDLREKGHECRVFELVAGHTIIRALDDAEASRVFPVEDGEKKEKKTYLQSVENTALGVFLESLKKLCSECGKISWGSVQGKCKEPPLFSVEIEPSISRLVHDRPSLITLLTHLRNDKRFERVGINLDIGHMMIVGIEADELISLCGDRIVHAHISGNALSHFADLPLHVDKDRGRFKPWLEVLGKLQEGGNSMYQGYVSLELEACQSIEAVAQTYEAVTTWLSELNLLKPPV